MRWFNLSGSPGADRARFLASRGLVDESFAGQLDQIASSVAVLRMMMLKARVTEDSSLIERIPGRLESVLSEEQDILTALRSSLDPRRRNVTVAVERVMEAAPPYAEPAVV